MERSEAERIVVLLYQVCFQRTPGDRERTFWSNFLITGTPTVDIIEKFVNSEEYKTRHKAEPFFAPGHYYSPIVYPNDDVRQYMLSQQKIVSLDPPGIDMMVDRMRGFFVSNVEYMKSATFEADRNDKHRYYYDNGGYPLGDALVLRTMINAFRPKKIIEIGSGFSTACMLDSVEEIEMKVNICCIEPYPERLRSLLRSHDRIELLECGVQSVGIERFSELEANDILFIDSTHVLKTGSDVHYELFQVIPALRPGVLIHFHDIAYPFEYPPEWIFEKNYSWNEAYGVRAFLMYNRVFVPFYSNSLLAQFERELVMRLFPGFPKNPGTNLWLRREAS